MSELQEAFREAARREFAHVPAEENLHWVFSRRFERRMRRIIRAQEYGYWNLVNTTAKRIAIAAAIIVMLLSTVMAIKPIRERVIKFFVEVYEEYFEIHFGEEESWDLPERTEPMVRYTLTELPAGFVEEGHVVSDSILYSTWINENGRRIILQQEPGTQEITVDNFAMDLSYIEHGELHITCQDNITSSCFIWRQEDYIFALTTYEQLEREDTLRIIDSLAIVTNNENN